MPSIFSDSYRLVYNAEKNKAIRNTVFEIKNSGNALGKMNVQYLGTAYENVQFLEETTNENIKKWFYDIAGIASYDVKNVNFNITKSAVPKAELNLDLTLNLFAAKTEKRLFFNPGIFEAKPMTTLIDQRKSGFKLRHSYLDVDTFEFKLPEDFKVESLPENIAISNAFGNYSRTIQLKEQSLYYIRRTEITSNNFPTVDYEKFKEFVTTVYQANKEKVVLVKNN